MATYKLRVNSIDVLDKSNNISWTSNADAVSLELSFESLYNLPVGAVVSFYIDNVEYFRGVILTKSDGKFVYSYKCLDYSYYLKNEVIKQFKNVTASAAIASLLKEYGIKSTIPVIPTKINKFYIDQSILDIINDILTIAGKDQQKQYFTELQGSTLIISSVTDMKITPKFYIAGDFKIDTTIEELKNRIIVVSDNKVLAVAEDVKSKSTYGILQQIELIDKADKARANAIAKSTLNGLNKPKNSTSLELLVIEGFEKIRANRLVYLSSGGMNGWIKIKSAAHVLSKGTHKVTIELEW